jgi:hypothetical protein
MKILKIELSDAEVSAMINLLTKKFNTEDRRQQINGEFSDAIDWDAELELYTETSDFDETRCSEILLRSVMRFRLTFYDVESGQEIEYTNADYICNEIEKYYEI